MRDARQTSFKCFASVVALRSAISLQDGYDMRPRLSHRPVCSDEIRQMTNVSPNKSICPPCPRHGFDI